MLRLDVRDPSSFENGRMDGARHVSHANLSALIAGTAKATPILIYCYRGHASRDYAQTFSDFGFAEVYSLDGGFEAWSKAPRALDAAPPGPALQRWLAAQGFPPGDVNAVIANETTPLMKAAHLGESAIVRDLLAAGARPEARNADGNNALWLACVGDHLEVIDLLVAAGIDVDNRNANGATALMYASSSGKAAVVAHLLAKGADTAPETLDGFTALDMAASMECLTLLRRASQSPYRVETGS
ncbi:MAG: ankyrin repeat domain-containing protein [Xanthobacteraceae bacterium]|nr:ankyrin repeat domain-containing protein [Xanthobacteraceae bacterium]